MFVISFPMFSELSVRKKNTDVLSWNGCERKLGIYKNIFFFVKTRKKLDWRILGILSTVNFGA